MTFRRRELRQFVRYCVVGAISNSALYVAFLVLLRLGMRPELAAAICYSLGVCLSYVLNRAWTFESCVTHKEDVSKFLWAYGVGLCSTVLMMNFLSVRLRPELAQLINIGVTAIIIYANLLLLRFGGGHASRA